MQEPKAPQDECKPEMASKNKVVVVGLDGLEPVIVETMLQANELPNSGRSAIAVCDSRLRTTYPAQTPAGVVLLCYGNQSWADTESLISSPRDKETDGPDIALSRFEKTESMLALPRVNNRKGVVFWEHPG